MNARNEKMKCLRDGTNLETYPQDSLTLSHSHTHSHTHLLIHSYSYTYTCTHTIAITIIITITSLIYWRPRSLASDPI